MRYYRQLLFYIEAPSFQRQTLIAAMLVLNWETLHEQSNRSYRTRFL
jgi:hypothetical protein